MLQILGYMVGAYGIARLLQTSHLSDSKEWAQVVGGIGIVVLAVCILWLTQQGSAIADLTG